MSKPASGAAGTPVASSPPASESLFSEFEGTAIGSVLDTTFGDAWEPPADASALNIVSWKLDVDARVEDGVDKRGFNAISTVLNHPSKKANPLRASRKPLPPLGQPPVLLPKAHPPSHYDAYLKSIAPLYETFVQSQKAVAASAVRATDLDDQERKNPNLPSLEAVPQSFFDTNFDLANPNTWAEVMEAAESSSKPRDTAVQESLSTHLDNLESHLVHEITLRSSSFFSALSNLQDLNSESTSCLTRISDLKTALSEVGGKQARKGLEIIDAQSRLRSLRETEGGIKRVAELDDFLRIAKGMSDGGDWAGSLGCLEDVVRWWERNGPSQGSSSQLPLTNLPALSNLPASVTSLTSNIASQLEGALSSLLLATLGEDDSSKSIDKETFGSRVRPMLIGLLRCGKLDLLTSVWRESVTTSVREGLRQHLPTNDDEGEGSQARPLGLSLQEMSHHDFLKLCQDMYASMLARLHRTHEMGDVMSAILTENASVPALSLATVGTSAPKAASFDPTDVLTSACELANTRASRIIAMRGEQHSALDLEQFVEVFKETWSFVVATEAINNRMIASLRGAITSQARGFLVAYHSRRLTRSARLVEEETWVQVDVPASTQHTVDLLVQAAVSDPGECFIPPKQDGPVSNGSNQPGRLVTVEDKTFHVVNATAESLSLLGDYLTIVINLELVVTDVISRIIEFLKSFNSRTCQVVLGAGAMRSAGLRNITAKHLALASQSLSVVVALIPYIREFLRRHLSHKQTVMLVEFDKLKRDYQEHQNEIHAKLVAIMADRLAVHCGELREIDWEVPPAKDGPHGYALMLVKETATLHKVLSKYLAQPTVEAVMSQVLAASVHRLSEEYSKVEFKSEDAKKRMLQDVALIVTRFTPLSESTATVTGLETLVRDKPTPRKPVGEAMRGFLRRNGSTEAKTPTSSEVPAEDINDDDEGDGLTEGMPAPPSPIKSPVRSQPGTPVRVGSPKPTGSPVRNASPTRPSLSPRTSPAPSPPSKSPLASPTKSPVPLTARSPLASPTKSPEPLLEGSPGPSSPAKSSPGLPAKSSPASPEKDNATLQGASPPNGSSTEDLAAAETKASETPLPQTPEPKAAEPETPEGTEPTTEEPEKSPEKPEAIGPSSPSPPSPPPKEDSSE